MALLAGAVSHTPEGEEVLRGARMRMARKPSAIARELLRNFPKGGKRRNKRGKRKGEKGAEGAKQKGQGGQGEAKRQRRKRRPKGPQAEAAKENGGEAKGGSEAQLDLAGTEADAVSSGGDDDKVSTVVDAVGDA